MQFARKVENFFFPCSKVVRALMAEHDDAMEQFRATVKHAQCVANRGGDVAAECIIGEQETPKERRLRHELVR